MVESRRIYAELFFFHKLSYKMPIIVGQDGLKRVQRRSMARFLCLTPKRFPYHSAEHDPRLPLGLVVDDGPATYLERDILLFGHESLCRASLDMGAPGKCEIKMTILWFFASRFLTHAIYFAIEGANRNNSRSLLSNALEKESPKELLFQRRLLSKQLLRHEKDASRAGMQGNLGIQGTHLTIFSLNGGIGERIFRNPLYTLPKSRLLSFEDRDKVNYFDVEEKVWWTSLFFCLERKAMIKKDQICLRAVSMMQLSAYYWMSGQPNWGTSMQS